ncbi:MAG: IS1 family transposase [Candidatus Binataceae bacterium]|nr:IS1 family transposase [Candidatus Binataceae bacterium]
MNPHEVFCPNLHCPARGRVGEGNIWIHARTPPRYRCTVCQRTFSPRAGTLFHRRQTDEATITCILTLLANGCPFAAIEAAYGVQRPTVRDWMDAAGSHGEAIHQHLVCQPRDLGTVQADEIRVKQQGGIIWLAMAMMVTTRLWLGGAISVRRDGALIARLLAIVKTCALPAPLLVCVDGFAAYVTQVRRMARTPEPRAGRRGRCRLVAWPGLVIGQVVKQRADGHVVGVTRRLAQGTRRWAHRLLGDGTIQTAYIERLNGTFRARLASLARRTRGLGRTMARLEGGMWLVGTAYNFCTPHRSLARGQTPAMAAGITDHVWSMDELLHYRVPPARWRPAEKWGRRTKAETALIARWAA